MIEFDQLWCGSYHDRRPLSELAKVEHVHGRLRIVINQRLLPRMGFFGPDDVCVGDWFVELRRLLDELTSHKQGVYVYDEGEQGQPAYRFVRDDHFVYVSVVEGTGGGAADPEWHNVRTNYTDLAISIDSFQRSLHSFIANEAGDAGRAWLAALAKP